MFARLWRIAVHKQVGQHGAGRLRLMAVYRQRYTVNSPSVLSFHSAHSRDTSASASWTVSKSIALDAHYTKMHVDTAGSLAFFSIPSSPRGNTLHRNHASIYLSHVHSVNLGARFTLKQRTLLFLGYHITRDADGRRSSAEPIQQVFSAAQTFPFAYQAPMARITVKLRQKLQWNSGWQLYRYNQDIALLGYLPDYHANTGYTSLSWSF